jgi:hypothetical protein
MDLVLFSEKQYIRRKKMKKFILNLAFLVALTLLCAVAFPLSGAADDTGCKDLEEDFAPVMKLRGTAAEGEIKAIANLLEEGSGVIAIDFREVSGEFCMLEHGTKNNMIHFSGEPENTPEDIIYFISPDAFTKSGLRVNDLPRMPTELGKMEPLKWYYYDGKSKEPHHGKKLHRDFLVMAIDVK